MIDGLFNQINTFRSRNGLPELARDAVGMKRAETRAGQLVSRRHAYQPGQRDSGASAGILRSAASGEVLASMNADPGYIVSVVWQDPARRAAMLDRAATAAGVSCIQAEGMAHWAFQPEYASLAQASAASAASTPVLDSEQWAFLKLINNYRAQNGAGPLQVSVALQNSSAWMSNDMAVHNGFSHTDSLGRDPYTRMSSFGYPYYPWGENIAGGFPDAQSVFNSWSTYCDPDSSGNCTYAHRKNMLNPSFVVMGIGRTYSSSSTYGWYWDTDFGGYLDQTISSAQTAPAITYFGASQYTISPGQPVTLSWITSGATTLTLDQGIGDVSGVTSKTILPTGFITYTLTATNSGGSATAPVTVAAASACDMNLIQQNLALLSFPPNIACATVHNYFVADITYRASDGNCYETNVSGTTRATCSVSTPALPNGQIPNPFDPGFNWQAANAQCWYTQGDTSGGVAPYGLSSQKICGLNSVGGYPNDVITILTPYSAGGVASTMSFSPSSLALTVPATQNLALNLSAPAPAGGMAVSLSSSNASAASVPLTVTVAAGAFSANVPVTAAAAGSATITASASNYGSTNASVTVSAGSAGSASSVVPAGGTPQSASVNTAFASPLSALVRDAGGNPVSGVAVTFSAPSSGAGGTFAGGAVTAATNGSGVATSAVFTANSAQGSYSVAASVSGAPPAAFALTNSAGVSGSSIGLPATLAMNPGDSTILAVTLAAPAPGGGVFVTLTDSNPSVAALNTSNVFIGEGQTSSTRARLTAGGAGSATVSASAPGFASASTQVQVGGGQGGTMSFSPPSLAISASATQNLTLTLPAPAPSGGVFVTLSSSNPAAVSTLANVMIAAGASTATVPVTGLASGSATITASAPGYTSASASVTVLQGLAIATASLTNGQTGTAYSQTLTATGGTMPYTWSLISGTLPGGLALNSATGQIGGIPAAAAANTPLTIRVTDASVPAQSAIANFTLTVSAGPGGSASSIVTAGGTPQSASVNTAFASPLSAFVRDAGGNPVGGVAVTFSAPLSGAGGTFAGGTITAATNASGVAVSAIFTANSAQGGYTVTASAPGVAAPAVFALTNSAGVSGPSLVLPANLAMNPGDSAAFPVTLSAPAPGGGVFVTLTGSNPSVAALNTGNVFIGEGQTSSARARLTAGAAGSASVTASASGFASASTQVQVGGSQGGSMSFSPSSLTLGVSASQNLNLALTVPAPVGGVAITLSSSNPAAVSSLANVIIAAGASTATVPVTGLAPGSATITASAPGYTSASASVTVTQAAAIGLPANVTVGVGQSVALPVTLSAPAPSGGATVSLVSGDTSKAAVTAAVFIAAGATSPASQPQVTGVGAGSAAITASASGYAAGHALAQVTAAAAGTGSFSPGSITVNVGSTQNLTLNLSAPAPSAGLSATVSSSNAGVATTPLIVNFAGNMASATVPVTGVAAGSATVTASIPGFGSANAGVTVSSTQSGIILPANTIIAPGQSASFQVTLAAPAPSGGVFISLVSGDTSKVTVAPDNIFVPQNATTASRAPTVTGVNAGTAAITASATGFAPASQSVQVGSGPTMGFSPASLAITAPSTQNLTLTLSTPAPAAGLTVVLSSTNPGVATAAPGVTFPANATSVIVQVTGLAPGSASITASAPGFPNASASITVAAQGGGAINLPSTVTVAQGQSAALAVTLPFPAPAGGVTVALASGDTSKATVTPSVFIAAGAASPAIQPQITGIGAGLAALAASAPGYQSGNGQVQVVAGGGGGVVFSPASLTIVPGGSAKLTLSLPAPAPSPEGLTAALSSSNAAAVAVPYNVYFPAGASSVSVAVGGWAAGVSVITASIPGYGNANAIVTVTTPQGVSVTWYGACWQPATLYGVTGNFQAVDFWLTTPVPVPLQGSLFFAANCDPRQGVDNMNDYGSVIGSTHSVQGFSHHPDVIPSSAIYWIGPRTADGMCPPGAPCSGCVNYNKVTPLCSALP